MNALSLIQIGAMLCVGLLLSAFFSGSETGFYRVARLRLALDGRSGDRIAKSLLWLANRPPLFVGTALIGNNLANYLTSFSILLATRAIMGGQVIAELIVPILAAPVVFVYGEFLPKYLYFMAPNKLLRRGGPLFLVCFVLFWPFTVLLSWLGRLLQYLLGEAPEEVRLRLARSEIHKLLDEGKEVGILRPAQRQLAQAVSDVAHHRVIRYGIPPYRLSSVYDTDTIEHVLQAARKTGATELLVTDRKSRTVEGYVVIGDLHSAGENWRQKVRPLARVRHTDSHLSAIVKMQTSGDALAEIIDISGRPAGVVSMRRLMEPLFG